MKLKYRPDIDGLRAIAVVAVVLYHYFPTYFGGGFVGVDIFFVISGYLVTSILISSNYDNSFSFKTFYFRRIRRIIPSLVVVLFATLALGAIALLSDEFQSLGLDTLAATLFSSNLLLIKEIGYFDSAGVNKPLLHVWSLSLEEQYYLVWPLILWVTLKFKKVRLGFVLSLLTIGSFLFNVVYIHFDQTYVFYSLSSRLWELAFGGLLFFMNIDLLPKKNYVLNLFSLLGFAGIIVSILSIRNNINFPGFMAALPVISTSLLIGAGSNGYFNKFLSQKYLVYIGLISYPIYLWHWPFNSMAQIVFSNQASSIVKIALIIITFLLAMLTFEFLEKPLRHINISNSLIIKIAAAFFLAGGVGYGIWYFKGFPGRYPAAETLLRSRIGLVDAGESLRNKECRAAFVNTEMCAITDISKAPTVVVIGDSHAAATYYGVKNYYSEKKENTLLLLSLASAPLVNISVTYHGKEHDLDDVFDYIALSTSIHTVVLSAFWAAYYEDSSMNSLMADHKYWTSDKNNLSERNQKIIFTNALIKTLKKLAALKKKIVIVLNMPLLDFNIKSCFKRPLVGQAGPCIITEEYAHAIYSNYRSVIAESIQKIPNSNISTYDPLSYLCTDGACPLIRDDKLLYIDTNHLSTYGAELLFKNYNN